MSTDRPKLTILMSNAFAVNQYQELMKKEKLYANIIVNIPFENYLHIIITSSWQDAFYFILANAFWLSPKSYLYATGGFVSIMIIIVAIFLG